MVRGPEIDADVTGEELDKDVRRELSTLRAEAAESAGKHLVMTARLLDDDPEGAYAHASAARKHGPRVGVIREALGLAAYRAGKYTEALAELRAARRITGAQDHWPLMADCERAMGRPEKALQMAAAPEVDQLTRAGKVEMRIVAAGARSDLGQLEAAVVTLKSPELNDKKPSEWLPRLRFAYAAALEAVGRNDEARTWFERAAEADPDGLTDAAERIAELDGFVILDSDEDLDDEQPDPAEQEALAAAVKAAVAKASAKAGVQGDAVPVVAAPVVAEPATERGSTPTLDDPFRAAPAGDDEVVSGGEEPRAELEGVLFLDPGDLS